MMSSDAVEAAPGAPATSYWCYRCSRFVRVRARGAVVCPDCETGFVELVDTPPRPGPLPATAAAGDARRRRGSPTSSAHAASDSAGASSPGHHSDVGFRRPRRHAAGDRSPFNPVIVLRGPSDGGGDRGGNADRAAASAFELYYDDGAGSGLRPLPASMSDFLMGAGFDRLLDQLSQIELNGVGGRWCDQPPASKAAVESMPTVEISEGHVSLDAHCAVCKEPFQLAMEAREMPCKHIYHQDCILPWLSLRNSCPVCRHELPTDVRGGRGSGQEPEIDEQSPIGGGGEEDTVGLTIWRLPGGGFAVGRFSGGRRAGERDLPVVYTEMDGGFSTSGAPRRISWTSRGSRSRESGGVARAFRSFFSFFGRLRRSSSSSSSSRTSAETGSSSSRIVGHVFGRNFGRRSRGWPLEDGSATGISR